MTVIMLPRPAAAFQGWKAKPSQAKRHEPGARQPTAPRHFRKAQTSHALEEVLRVERLLDCPHEAHGAQPQLGHHELALALSDSVLARGGPFESDGALADPAR